MYDYKFYSMPTGSLTYCVRFAILSGCLLLDVSCTVLTMLTCEHYMMCFGV